MTKKFYKAIKFVALICFLILSHLAFSQTTDLSKVKVDDLTDTQIRQIISRAASVGYTSDEQIAQVAISQGLNRAEAQKLTDRINKIKKQDATSNKNLPADNSGDDRSRSYNEFTDTLNSDTSKISRRNLETKRKDQLRDALGNLIPKIFGQDLFKNNGRNTFEPNLRIATPKNYVVGPDDVLLIDITGDNEVSYKPKVSPDGTIAIQYAGLISVGGLTVEAASSKIRAALAKTYPGIRSGRTSVSINLGNIRSIKVNIVGEVTRPGSYTLSSLSTVFNALYASGGPNDNGSLRSIQVVRNSKIIAIVDVYDFLLNGVQKNIRLQDQDVINIPVYKTRIEMNGEFKRPALYEITLAETLQDAINFAGGFTSAAYTAGLKILQSTGRERKIVDIAANRFRDYHPLNGDKVIAEQILERYENRVSIEGAVFRPGKYELDKGFTLKQLILKADGLKEDAFLNRGYINRLNADNTPSLITFDVRRAVSGADPDIVLQREDQVIISSIFDLRDEYTVNIQGQVRAPGQFKFREGMNLENLIQEAGGFQQGATPSRIEIARRVQNSDPLSKNSPTAQIFTVSVDKDLRLVGAPFILQPFDIVSIRSAEGFQRQKSVLIQGEVLYPGNYAVKSNNDKILNILQRAGGLTVSAFPEGASLRRRNRAGNSGNGRDIDTAQIELDKTKNLKRLALAQRLKDTTGVSSEDIAVQKSDYIGMNLVKILRDSTSRENLLVEDGDIITVPRQFQTVSVTGSVLRPTNIVYAPGKTMQEYINEAGGFTDNANKRGAYVVYPNGSVKATKKLLFFYNYPGVKPGSEIFVPKSAPKVPLGIQGIIGISTALASLAVIVITLFKK
ncbi:SLBB domain-containing protein [Mucilaginibacter ginkgonis]|uniref:SLBB domain-containing protein n=2 Tax=Mucilaginibacter ginkgonis TaxID=2682091 RepID=A0A6I4IPC7_9SPHI|nr:SLBB domain-containing protein [Mucilaginibacter ginkgonis]